MSAISLRVRLISGILACGSVRKAVSCFEEGFFTRDRGKTRRIRIGPRLIWRNQMASGAPALGDDPAFRRIGGPSSNQATSNESQMIHPIQLLLDGHLETV
jgi:hypothetical protein